MKICKIGVAIFIACLVMGFFAEAGYAELMIDRFEETSNLLGGRSNVYVEEPSRILAYRSKEDCYGDSGKALVIQYDKKAEGGPNGEGGWCGYYTLLKKGDAYFDATGYKAIGFWVKGDRGGENFKLGIADRHWDLVGDSLKSEDIGTYLASGNVTIQWQKATIPLDIFFLDYSQLSAIAICFESECFGGGAGRGIIYIDNLALE